MTFFLSCLAFLLNTIIFFTSAPLLTGTVTKCQARLLGRVGAPVAQPYRDLRKLLRKTPLVPDTATDLYRLWPYAAFAATGAAALLVPGFAYGGASAPFSDVIVFVGLLVLARAATMLAGLETGFGFGGAAAARAALAGIFAEAALLVAVLALVLSSHVSSLDGICRWVRGGPAGFSVSFGFALAALAMVALAAAGRLPIERPAGQMELEMQQDALLLEYSGRYLALFHYTAMLRLMMWMALIVAIFLPFGMADAARISSWPLGLVVWFGKLGCAAFGLAVWEVSVARMRVTQAPVFLGTAVLLGLLSVVFS